MSWLELEVLDLKDAADITADTNKLTTASERDVDMEAQTPSLSECNDDDEKVPLLD